MRNSFLTGHKVYLRSLEDTDAYTDYPSWLNDTDITAFSEQHYYPYTVNNAVNFIKSLDDDRSKLMLAIVENDSDKHIGNIALSSISTQHKSAEFSIMIGNKDFHSKGCALDAASLIIDHGFKTMNLHRIFCGTMENNIPMHKLAIKLNMIKEGVVRDEVFKDGKYHNCIRYSILKSEWL